MRYPQQAQSIGLRDPIETEAATDASSINSTPPVVPSKALLTCPQWLDLVEELCLDSQGIQQIQDLKQLPNLRRLSLAHNDLISMKGFLGCSALEELLIEDNRITVIEALDSCTRLKRLDIGGNAITTVTGMEYLQNLTQLSLENNQVSALTGLEKLSSLMELYIANNFVDQTNQLDTLRSLSKLIILDLSGNPMCQTPQYRTYTIFRCDKVGESWTGRLCPDVIVLFVS